MNSICHIVNNVSICCHYHFCYYCYQHSFLTETNIISSPIVIKKNSSKSKLCFSEFRNVFPGPLILVGFGLI